MTLPPHTVRPCVAPAIALICAALFVTRAQTAQAGMNVWTSQGPGTNVDVFALAIDPSTPSTLYAGGAPGGVFKSTDRGRSWQAIGSWQAVLADMRGTPGVYALAIDRTTPATLYAGTVVSERNEGFAGGVFKSTDAGSTWQAANDDFTYATVAGTVAIDPSTPGTLYAGYLGGGVSKSTDSGDSWQPVNAGLGNTDGIFALAIDPGTPSTLYAATSDGGVFDLEQVPLFCVGDCGGRQTVAINGLITLVKIALGTAQSSACQNGVPSSDDVNVVVLIQAVNNALSGCMTPTPTLTPTPTATWTLTIGPTLCSACTPTVTPAGTARKAA